MVDAPNLLPRRRGAIEPEPATVPEVGVRLSEAALAGKLSIRGDASDAGSASAIADVLGIGPPPATQAVAAEGEVAVLWLGPNEWLAVLPPGDEEPASRRLAEALPPVAAVVDVTDALAVIDLTGPEAHAVLAKLCPLDLRPEVFSAGRVARTLVAGVDAIVQPAGGEGSGFRLLVARSYAEYLWEVLLDAGEEYGVAVDA